eukprot:COSAG01_NODE_449_length_16915_cov_23.001903_4_plen_214_part_00
MIGPSEVAEAAAEDEEAAAGDSPPVDSPCSTPPHGGPTGEHPPSLWNSARLCCQRLPPPLDRDCVRTSSTRVYRRMCGPQRPWLLLYAPCGSRAAAAAPEARESDRAARLARRREWKRAARTRRGGRGPGGVGAARASRQAAGDCGAPAAPSPGPARERALVRPGLRGRDCGQLGVGISCVGRCYAADLSLRSGRAWAWAGTGWRHVRRARRS